MGNIRILEDIPLSEHTTFHVGGTARYFVSVQSLEELLRALVWAKEKNVDIFFLGSGSNIVFSDAVYEGLVIHFSSDGYMRRDGFEIGCFSGCLLRNLLDVMRDSDMSGLENMAGISGSVGGAVRGNAGAFGSEIKDCLVSVDALHRETFLTRTFSRDECNFSYRTSLFKRENSWIIFGALFRFEPGDRARISRIMEETVRKRNEKHRQDVWCAGSFFMNPMVEDEALRGEFEQETGSVSRGGKVPAGWIIDKAGLRGRSIGGAMVSTQHPNYIINTGNATASDIVILMSIIKQKVRDTYNIELKEEVQLVGF